MTIMNNVYVPREVLFNIYSQLSTSDLLSCSKVNRAFREMALNKMLLESRFPNISVSEDVTIQQWFLQGIHTQEDVLKFIEHYFSQIPDKQITTLTVKSSVAYLQVVLGYGVDDKAPVIDKTIQVNTDILLTDEFARDGIRFHHLTARLFGPKVHCSIRMYKVKNDDLLEGAIETTIKKVVAKKSFKGVLGNAIGNVVQRFSGK